MNWFNSYFTYRKGERKAILIIAIALAAVIIINFSSDFLFGNDDYDASEINNFREYVQKLKGTPAGDASFDEISELTSTINEIILFNFDPNTLPEHEWQRLGLHPGLIRTIINFRNKGGKFFRKEDLKKIYGMSDYHYNRLEPYIKIKKQVSENNNENNKVARFQHLEKQIIINLNTADSAELTLIRGVGPAFASRIIKYRERLRGFRNKEQLLEVFGIDSVAFERIAPQIELNNNNIHTININMADARELAGHPYITFREANAIIRYREANGQYRNLSELNNLYLLNAEFIEKIIPYLSVE